MTAEAIEVVEDLAPPAAPPVHPAPADDVGPEDADVPAGAVTAATPLPLVDRCFYALSSAADHGLIWLALGSARAARRGEPVVALRLGALLASESVFTNGAVKALFHKRRPRVHFTHEAPLPYGMRRPITSSFPSGHATTAFMAAGLLGTSAPTSAAYHSLAALIAYSRVHVRMHYPVDVVAGAALGVVLGRLARRFLPLER